MDEPEKNGSQPASDCEAPVEADSLIASEQATGKPQEMLAEVEAAAPAGEPVVPVAPVEDLSAPVAPVEVLSAPVVPGIRLEKKHPLAIRWMHWINFPVLFTMIWSGMLIYWNDSDNAYKHPHAVYRIGLGSFTLFRFFPEAFWKALHVPFHVTEGLGYHFFFFWIFAINGIAYVLYTVFSGEWRFIVPDRKSLKEAIDVTLKDLHLSKYLPPQTKYNGAQKIAYTSVVLMGAGSLITGLAIYQPTQVHMLTTLLGGYQMARWEHFMLTLGFCGFFLVHVTQVILAGWNNFRSMISGLEVKSVQEPSLEEERKSWR